GAAAASRGPASSAEWALARAFEPQARPAAIPATTRTRTRLAIGPRVDFLVMANSDSVVLEGIRDSPDGMPSSLCRPANVAVTSRQRRGRGPAPGPAGRPRTIP